MWHEKLMPGAAGLIDLDTSISDVQHSTSTQDTRDLPDHLLSSHLHTPTLRLCYVPMCLQVLLCHLPGHLPSQVTCTSFFTNHTIVNDVVEAILDDFYIPRRMQKGIKTGKPEFVLSVGSRPLQPDLRLVNVLTQRAVTGPPFQVEFSLSPEWLAQAGTVAQGFQKPPATPSGNSRPALGVGSISGWKPSSLFGGLWPQSPTSSTDRADVVCEEDDEEGGTLKAQRPGSYSANMTPTTDKQKIRLSSLFEGWLPDTNTTSSPPSIDAATLRSRIVSAPMVLDDQNDSKDLQKSIDTRGSGEFGSSTPTADLDTEFEDLISDLGFKEAQADSMRSLPEAQKSYLLAQHRGRTVAPFVSQQTGSSEHDSSSSRNSSFFKRFSLASLGYGDLSTTSFPSDTSPPSSPGLYSRSPSVSSLRSYTSLPSANTSTWMAWFSSSSFKAVGAFDPAAALTPQITGADDTPIHNLAAIRNAKSGSSELVRKLIALRVKLSTAKLSWIKAFMRDDGLAVLQGVFKATNERALSHRHADVDETVRGECIRCIRALLNVEVCLYLLCLVELQTERYLPLRLDLQGFLATNC